MTFFTRIAHLFGVGVIGATMTISVTVAARADEDIAARTKAARDYVEGKLKVPEYKITYDGPPITVRFSSFVAATVPLWTSYRGAFKQLEKESKGKLIVKEYPGGVLHAMTDGFKAVRSGVTDMTQCYASYQPTSFNLMNGTGNSGLFPDAVVGAVVAAKIYPKYMKKEYENIGVYLARTSMTPAYNLVSKKPIHQLEDLKGMKIRAVGGVQAEQMRAVGALPVFLSTPEAYTGFQRGTVDGVVAHDAAFVSFRTAEVAKNWADLKFATVELDYCMRKEFYDGLPKDLKVVFYNWLQRWNLVDAQLWFETYAAIAREKIEAQGIEMVKLAPVERERILGAMGKVDDQWTAKMEAKGLPAKAMMQDIKRLVAEDSKKSWNELFMETVNNPVQGLVD
ncbi:MAG: TRAP transporter substrate-binding protein DctP [Pseudolabrys sp.]